MCGGKKHTVGGTEVKKRGTGWPILLLTVNSLMSWGWEDGMWGNRKPPVTMCEDSSEERRNCVQNKYGITSAQLENIKPSYTKVHSEQKGNVSTCCRDCVSSWALSLFLENCLMSHNAVCYCWTFKWIWNVVQILVSGRQAGRMCCSGNKSQKITLE